MARMIGVTKTIKTTNYKMAFTVFLLGQIVAGSAVATNVAAGYTADGGITGANTHDVAVFNAAGSTLTIGSAGSSGLVDNSAAPGQAAVVSSALSGAATINVTNGSSIVTTDGSAVINFSSGVGGGSLAFVQGAAPGAAGIINITNNAGCYIKNQNAGVDNPAGIAITLANQANARLTLTNYGTIVGNVWGSNGNDTLNLAGTVQGNIDSKGGALDTINIIGNFTTNGIINRAQTINVNNNATFNINNPINILSTLFNTTAGTTTTIGTGGNITPAAGSLGGAAGTVGTITNAGTLTVSGTGTIGDTGTIGAITNTGTINLGGGNVTTTGAFTNNGGNLTITSGTVGITGAFTNGAAGTVNIKNSTTTITGAYNSNAATSTHIANVVDGTAQPLNVTGVANLNGSAVKIATSGSTLLTNGQTLDIILGGAAPTIVGTTVAGLVPSPALAYAIAANGTNVRVTVTRTPGSTLVTSTTAKATASVVNDGITNNQFSSDAKAVFNLIDQETTTAGITKDYTQLSPDTNGAQGLQAASFVASSIANAASAERIELMARSGITDINTGYAAGGMQSSKNLWIKGLGSTMLQKERQNFLGYNANTSGFAFGGDKQIHDNTWGGLGLSYANTRIRTKDLPANKTKINSYQATLYSSYSPAKYYVDGFLSLAINQYKTERNIIFADRTAHGKFNGIQPSAKVASGYMHTMGDFRIIPNVSLQYTLLHQAKYDEHGAGGVSLKEVSSKDVQKIEGGIGIKFALLQKNDSKFLNPDLHFMVLRDFNNTNQETTSQFTGGGGDFTIDGAKPAKTTFNVGASLTYIKTDRLHCTINYDMHKKSKFIGHSGSLALKYMI